MELSSNINRVYLPPKLDQKEGVIVGYDLEKVACKVGNESRVKDRSSVPQVNSVVSGRLYL